MDSLWMLDGKSLNRRGVFSKVNLLNLVRVSNVLSIKKHLNQEKGGDFFILFYIILIFFEFLYTIAIWVNDLLRSML